MEKYISVVIPNFNKEDTIGTCLEAAFSSDYKYYEVIVVDDLSDDNSVDIIKQYPCKLIRLDRRAGTSRARNIGALNSSGEIVFFIDADCLLQKDTLSIVNRTLSGSQPDMVIGGTYTRDPYDKRFFSTFQSVFVNHSETKKLVNPDYIAAHALIMNADVFRKSGGFPEDFFPIIEDVEFTHRLRKSGHRLMMNPDIQVQHIFNFSFVRSLCNAFRKSAYWCMYSLRNRDLFVDSGAASAELKTNVISFFLIFLFLGLWIVLSEPLFLIVLPLILIINTYTSRRLLKAFMETRGLLFAGLATLYYTMLYPIPVGMGTLAGMMRHFWGSAEG